jgi:hypothetical protein
MATLGSSSVKQNIPAIPEIGNFTKILFYLRNNDVNWNYFNYFKEITTLSDEITSNWLNINSKTLRAYRKPESVSKDNIKEHLVLLIALYQHGNEVFEGKENFDGWLISENYYFDRKAPMDFLDTITGIKFIDDRLTSIEFGDTV